MNLDKIPSNKIFRDCHEDHDVLLYVGDRHNYVDAENFFNHIGRDPAKTISKSSRSIVHVQLELKKPIVRKAVKWESVLRILKRDKLLDTYYRVLMKSRFQVLFHGLNNGSVSGNYFDPPEVTFHEGPKLCFQYGYEEPVFHKLVFYNNYVYMPLLDVRKICKSKYRFTEGYEEDPDCIKLIDYFGRFGCKPKPCVKLERAIQLVKLDRNRYTNAVVSYFYELIEQYKGGYFKYDYGDGPETEEELMVQPEEFEIIDFEVDTEYLDMLV